MAFALDTSASVGSNENWGRIINFTTTLADKLERGLVRVADRSLPPTRERVLGDCRVAGTGARCCCWLPANVCATYC